MRQERISALLFRTGYEKVIERGVTNDFNFSHFEGEAAAFLVELCEQQGIRLNLVGLDSFSMDPKGTPDSPARPPVRLSCSRTSASVQPFRSIM